MLLTIEIIIDIIYLFQVVLTIWNSLKEPLLSLCWELWWPGCFQSYFQCAFLEGWWPQDSNATVIYQIKQDTNASCYTLVNCLGNHSCDFGPCHVKLFWTTHSHASGVSLDKRYMQRWGRFDVVTYLESQVIEMTDTMPVALHVREAPHAISDSQPVVCYFLLFYGS